MMTFLMDLVGFENGNFVTLVCVFHTVLSLRIRTLSYTKFDYNVCHKNAQCLFALPKPVDQI